MHLKLSFNLHAREVVERSVNEQILEIYFFFLIITSVFNKFIQSVQIPNEQILEIYKKLQSQEKKVIY